MNKFLLIAAGLLLATPVMAEDANTSQSTPATPMAEKSIETLAGGTVARSTFTNGIADREPVDSINKLANNNSKIYYFSELRDMAGQTVTHRWEHNGKVMAEVPFTVGGDRWRVFSSKNLEASWEGEWKVSVIDQSGGTLAVNTFKYEKKAADSTDAATPMDATLEINEAPDKMK